MIPKTYLQKKGKIGYDGNKKIKGIKLSVITEKDGLPIALFIAPANYHDSRLYLPTIQDIKIKLSIGRPITRPKLINADSAYDTKEIRGYNRKKGIITNIPVNKRNRKNPRKGRPSGFNKIEYAGRDAVERFFSWIEANKKIYPRHERLEQSYLGLVMLACSLMLWRV